MGNKGGLGHLKRLASPSFWPVHRKEATWVPKPNPGAHGTWNCLPLQVVIRDGLALARTKREASNIVAEGKVKVDGRARRERNHPAGLMDVIEFTEGNLVYRILPVPRKGLTLVKIPKDEAKFKLCKILRKTTAPSGHVQYGLHDGRTLNVLPTDAEATKYQTNDTLRISIPTQRVLNQIKFEKGNFVLVIAGSSSGRNGKILEMQKGTATRPAMVTIEDTTGSKFETIVDYTFVVGTDKPAIKLEAS